MHACISNLSYRSNIRYKIQMLWLKVFGICVFEYLPKKLNILWIIFNTQNDNDESELIKN